MEESVYYGRVFMFLAWMPQRILTHCVSMHAASYGGHVPPLFQSHVKNFFCAKKHYSNAIEKRE